MFIAAQEQLISYDSIWREKVFTGPWHPVHHLVVVGNVGVEDSEGADNFATDIREHGIFDLVACRETEENFTRIIGDRRCINSVGFQLSECVLQLDELIAAIGSPVRAAAEDEQQPI